MNAHPTVDISKRVDQYIRLRDEIKRREDAHKSEMKPFKEALEKLNGALLERTRAPFAASRAWLDRAAPTTPLLNRVLYADLKTYLVELLMKQDQMSMAASIESRVIFAESADLSPVSWPRISCSSAARAEPVARNERRTSSSLLTPATPDGCVFSSIARMVRPPQAFVSHT